MSENLESIPDEPPLEVEAIAHQTDAEKEKFDELAIMIKAEQLFRPARLDDDPHRSPDDVSTEASTIEKFSFLHDNEGEDKRDRRMLTYRRVYRIGEDNEEELILNTQVIEYRESDNTVETLITCDRFPVAEIPEEILKRVEEFIDYHIAKVAELSSSE